MRSIGLALGFIVTIGAGALGAQTPTAELDVTAGVSTENVRATSSQLRLFGEAGGGWSYFAEATWADVWGPTSDAFGAAYPYDRRLHAMELFAEKTFRSGPYLAGVRLGRYRTPFGMYGRSDHAYNGFLRAPLIRYGSYWALSNNFLEGGASVMAGVPRLFGEVSLGVPQDEDVQRRRQGLDRVVRVQGVVGPVIVGASHIRTLPSDPHSWVQGAAIFSGVDVRWMHAGTQLRGEWIHGRPFDGTTTYGGYLDAIVHRPFMGPLTAVARAEKLDYLAGPFSSYPRRLTAGARIRFARVMAGQMNVVRQFGNSGSPARTSLDLAVTVSTTSRRH